MPGCMSNVCKLYFLPTNNPSAVITGDGAHPVTV